MKDLYKKAYSALGYEVDVEVDNKDYVTDVTIQSIHDDKQSELAKTVLSYCDGEGGAISKDGTFLLSVANNEKILSDWIPNEEYYASRTAFHQEMKRLGVELTVEQLNEAVNALKYAIMETSTSPSKWSTLQRHLYDAFSNYYPDLHNIKAEDVEGDSNLVDFLFTYGKNTIDMTFSEFVKEVEGELPIYLTDSFASDILYRDGRTDVDDPKEYLLNNPDLLSDNDIVELAENILYNSTYENLLDYEDIVLIG